MDLLGYLYDSDAIKIGKVSFVYRFDPAVADGGQGLQYDVCPGKPRGKLVLDLDVSTLHPLVAGLDFHATVNGTPAGFDANGDVLIAWSTDQLVGKYLAALDVNVDRMTAHFVTTVKAVDPATKRMTCDGAERFFGALIETTGQDNGFVLECHQTILGVAHGARVIASDLTLTAMAGHPDDLGVAIKVPHGLCANRLVEGGQGSAVASVTPPGTNVTYAWRVEGANAVGPVNGPLLTFQAIGAAPVHVSVEVRTGERTAFDTTSIVPLPPDMVHLLDLICKLRTVAVRNAFIDPLWDPLRDYKRQPVTEREAMHIDEFAARITQLATEIRDVARPMRNARPRGDV